MMDQVKSVRRPAAGIRRSRRGETLTETLIAMLIIGLSSVLFLTMVSASGRIFRKAEELYGTTGEEEKSVYRKITEADVQTNPRTDISEKITVKGESDPAGVPVEVNWYGEQYDGKDYVLSYKVR